MQAIGFVRSPYHDTREIPKGCGATAFALSRHLSPEPRIAALASDGRPPPKSLPTGLHQNSNFTWSHMLRMPPSVKSRSETGRPEYSQHL